MHNSQLFEKLLSYPGFSIDSRAVESGHLFFALPGEKTDGHRFLQEVAQKRGVASVVSRGYSGPDFGLTLFPVDDQLLTLQQLARYKLQKNRPQVVGVTGTVGKTTCKEFIAALLDGFREIAWSPKSCNSQISLPLTILNHSGWGEEILILEMGMSQKGEIARLVEIAPPDISVITALSLVHAENFTSVDEITQAKGEILSRSETKLGLIPPSPLLQSMGTCPKKTISFDDLTADYHPKNVPLPCLKLPPHHLYNALVAMAVCRELGMQWEELLPRTKLLKMLEGRGTIVEKKGIYFVNDAYNASPESMKAALNSLPQTMGKRLAILGPMKELGKFSEAAHEEVGTFALEKLDHLICTGRECFPMAEIWRRHCRPIDHFDQNDQALSTLKQMAKPGDVVLLKGSHSCRLWEILEEF